MCFRNKLLVLFAFIFFINNQETQAQVKHTFALGDSVFLLDGKPFLMISGEIHYPRVPREAWRARMKMAKAMGLNTIGTYVFWNLHEPQKGKFDFSGNNDIAEFVKIAKEEGLWVILRPSPYICAEWEFGGYPYWLQNEKGLVIRSKDTQYLREYEKYINEVGRRLAPLQINHGGNILMVQIENEYGSYGLDKEYLEINKQLFKKAGFDGLLYTCDPEADLSKGYLPGLLPAVNGTDEPENIKKLVRQYHSGKGPFFVAEWYPAWFDWWGTKHHTIPAARYSRQLDSILSAGISINMYMFHGGSTRGFMNGANYKDTTPYEPQISSYDYDAPLDEAGNPTPKFMAFRKVIEKYLPAGQHLPPVPATKHAIGINAIRLTQTASIFNDLPEPKINLKPLTFEDLHQAYGFVLYRTTLQGGKTGTLKLKGLRDYAVVMINGRTVGTLDRRLNQDSLSISLPPGMVRLEILVENLGRINFGKYMLENNKGITDKVLFNNSEVLQWQMFRLPFDDVKAVKFSRKTANISRPIIRKGTFHLQKTADTYLDMADWGKGVVWINGHNLGRYWKIGPQQTLFVPAEWLRRGNNEIVVFELIKPEQSALSAIDRPILNKLQ